MNIDGVERRKGLGVKARLLSWLTLAAWLCFIIALIVYHYARPEQDYGIFRYRGIAVRDHWIADLRIWFELLLAVCAGLSLITLIINKRLMKRKTDRFGYNLVLLLLICVAAFLLNS